MYHQAPVRNTYKETLFDSCALKQFIWLFNMQSFGMTAADVYARPDIRWILDDLTDEEAERIKFEEAVPNSQTTIH